MKKTHVLTLAVAPGVGLYYTGTMKGPVFATNKVDAFLMTEEVALQIRDEQAKLVPDALQKFLVVRPLP